MQYEEPYKHHYEHGRSYPGEAGYTPGYSEQYRDIGTRQWALALHLSQFAWCAFPVLGVIVPILIWQLKKGSLPGLDAHGRIVMNWLLSTFIYGVISILLIVVVVGVPMLIVLGLLGVVFPIIGAIKASDGVVWRYPLSIRFF